MLQVTKAKMKELLAAMIGVGGILEAPTVRLFKNNYFPSKDSVIGDFTLADFTGYATSTAVTWGAPHVNADGNLEIQGGVKQFTATDGATPNTVYGYLLTTAGGALIAAERFDVPVPVSAADDAVVVAPRFTLTLVS